MTAPTGTRTCYLHPDRVAGITCQRCDRPICPACMHQASVGFHCPECARGGRQRVYQGAASWATRPIASQVLIALNALVFVVQAVTSGLEPWTDGGRFLFLRYGDKGIWADGALVGSFVPEEPWRLVTGGFLHAQLPFGIIHIGMNMYVLSIFGRLLEPALGKVRFTAVYICALFGGSLGVVLLSPTSITVGASGAVFGMMGAAVMVARERGINLMQSGLATTIGINLLFTFGVPGISIGGHLGGLVAGFAAGALVVELPKRLDLGSKGEVVASGLAIGLGLVFGVVAYVLMVGQYG